MLDVLKLRYPRVAKYYFGKLAQKIDEQVVACESRCNCNKAKLFSAVEDLLKGLSPSAMLKAFIVHDIHAASVAVLFVVIQVRGKSLCLFIVYVEHKLKLENQLYGFDQCDGVGGPPRDFLVC